MKLLPTVASFPSLESLILISPACSGVHPYFSSAIHNSKQELGKKEKERGKHPWGLIFYHKMTISNCASGQRGPAKTSVESSTATGTRAVALWVTGIFLFCHTVALRSCDGDGLSVSPGVSACQVTNRRFLWTCDGVKTRVWRRRPTAEAPSVNSGFFFGSLGVNHQGSFPLTELPSVKMCPSRSPGVAFPIFLRLALIRSPLLV